VSGSIDPARRLAVQPATPDDVELVCALIRELAEYEQLAHACVVTTDALREQLFGARPAAECLIGLVDGVPQGFALFFTSFSTFLCRPGIWLEDLYVRPAARGAGLGRALLVRLARIAVERGCGRLEWTVLDWNESALGFYRALGARPMDEWTTQRLDGDALAALARTT
jgi:GNAT superfamily N-acetyltransferase